MRTTFDRIRQAVSFEIIGLVLFIPLSSLLFGHGVSEMGPLAVFGATLATVWNYFYNLGFDRMLVRLRGTPKKSVFLRIAHALGFEGGLLIFFLPVVAWWLQIGLWDAFLLDLSFAVFYLCYAFVFTWIYDTIFPPQGAVPAGKPERAV